ncbi:hypothetical protein ABD87_22855 [Lysinibacillus sphaericus]|uniref:hypothetical protein n=1 Tax=Lysinibacillus sphaericus TaxID=1421 RepID=UPI0018CE3BE3|nr:hypothetical protein [Lysinibacillus sphaericus]MBG9732268.1 hypothetical protein [Lysinibacillus sphaericus]
MNFKPHEKGYSPLYDGLPRYNSILTRIGFIAESLLFTLVSFFVLIVPFTINVTTSTLNQGMSEGFDIAFYVVPIRAFLVSCASLLFTVPYGFARVHRYGKKSFFTAIITVLLLTLTLSIWGLFLSALGLLGK